MTDSTPADRAYLCHVLRANAKSLPSFHAIAMEKAASEIERLVEERDDLIEQLSIRSESGMAKDMQKIMAINNELLEENRQLKSGKGA